MKVIPSKPNTKSYLSSFLTSSLLLFISNTLAYLAEHKCEAFCSWLSFRSISIHQLNTSLCLHLEPIYLVVFKGPSTKSRISHLEGGFTLRCLQRLSRPDLATLPWAWYPTDTPVVRPSRSSRTKDSSSQISYAHAG